jgi:hypothetical protein
LFPEVVARGKNVPAYFPQLFQIELKPIQKLPIARLARNAKSTPTFYWHCKCSSKEMPEGARGGD